MPDARRGEGGSAGSRTGVAPASRVPRHEPRRARSTSHADALGRLRRARYGRLGVGVAGPKSEAAAVSLVTPVALRGPRSRAAIALPRHRGNPRHRAIAGP